MIGGTPITPGGSSGPSASLSSTALTRPPVPCAKTGFSLVEIFATDHRPGATAPSLSAADYKARIKAAASQLFSGKSVVIPEEPAGKGLFGEVYRFEVDGVAYRLKLAAFDLLQFCRGMSLQDLTSGNLPDLTVEHKGLQKAHPRIPKLAGAITDSPRDGEPSYVLGLVTRWEEGTQLSDALRDGTITKGEAKIELAEVLGSLVRSGIYYLDLKLDNFIVRAQPPGSVAKGERPEIVVVDMGLWAERTDRSDLEFLESTRKCCDQIIDESARKPT